QGYWRLDIASGKPVAAIGAALSFDRNSEGKQPIDVAIDRPQRHLKTLRQRRSRHQLAPGQHEQDAECALDRIHDAASLFSGALIKDSHRPEHIEIKPDSQLSGLLYHPLLMPKNGEKRRSDHDDDRTEGGCPAAASDRVRGTPAQPLRLRMDGIQ